MEKIEIEIEKLRKELYELVSSKDVFDKEVVMKSKKLDRLLNKFNELKFKKSNRMGNF